MAQLPTLDELKEFALNFDEEIVAPLVAAGYDQCNVFDILNLSRQELKHSDFLAYLFNQNKSGEIGREFLKNFLICLARIDKVPNLDVFDILYGNIKNVNVYREYTITDNRRIDILIDFAIIKLSKAPQKIVIAIENKVDSDQHDEQLKHYKNFLTSSQSKYEKYEKLLLYLTPDQAPPNEEGWQAIDYIFINQVLDKINIENADPSIRILIEDYKIIIRSEFMDEAEAKKKALEIYGNEKNRKILDFIFECKSDWVSTTAGILCDLLEDKGATIVTVNGKGEIAKAKKRDYANLAFTVKALDKYPTHYFQIYVKDLLLVFRKDLTHNQCSQQWLFVNDKQSHEEVEKYQALAASDVPQLRKECKQLIDQMFAKGGVIDQCLAYLK